MIDSRQMYQYFEDVALMKDGFPQRTDDLLGLVTWGSRPRGMQCSL